MRAPAASPFPSRVRPRSQAPRAASRSAQGGSQRNQSSNGPRSSTAARARGKAPRDDEGRVRHAERTGVLANAFERAIVLLDEHGSRRTARKRLDRERARARVEVEHASRR